MIRLLKLICATVYFIIVCFNSEISSDQLLSKPGSKQIKEISGQNKIVDHVSRNSGSRALGFHSGVLNSFENVTNWAQVEEIIFNLALSRHYKLQAELSLLEEYTELHKKSASKSVQGYKLHLTSLCERIGCINSDVTQSPEADNEYSYMLALLLIVNKSFNSATTDLNKILSNKYPMNIGKPIPDYLNVNAGLKHQDWPNLLDLELAMYSLIRIQEVYNYDYKELPAALSPETNKAPQLNAFHAKEIGMHALYREQFAVAVEFMEHGMERVHNDQDYTVPIEMMNFDLELAVEMHNEMLEAVKSSPSLIIHTLFEDFVTSFPLYSPKRKRRSTYQLKSGNDVMDFKLDAESKFNAICAGEDKMSIRHRSLLYCWYDTSSSPARRILPHKKELLSLEPEVIQIYDFLGDNLISTLLKRRDKCSWLADTVSVRTLPQKMRIRTASMCWSDEPELEEFVRKVSSLTLTDLRAEASYARCNLIDYLFGRFHRVHIDTLQLKANASVNQEKIDNHGDRIMTVLFYFNDVPSGGSTAFPTAGMAAHPVKGSVVVWKNVYKNGSARLDTWHGGCPVIYGHKQSGVIRIHFDDQFLTHPCATNQYE